MYETALGSSGPLSSSLTERAFSAVPLAKSYRSAVICLTALGVLVLGTSFVVGTDPAVLTPDESDGLRRELQDLRAIEVGDFVFLNDGSPHRWVLGPGFAPPEADGTWVRAQRAQLIFYLPETIATEDSPLSLELSVSPLLTDGEVSRPVTFKSSSDEVTVDLEAGGSRVFVNLPSSSEQIVEIVCDSLDNPASEQSAIDVRRLCVKVYAMAVWTELVER